MKLCSLTVACFAVLLLTVENAFGQQSLWSGVWVTDLGVLDLDQDGDTISGTLNGESQVDGQVDGDEITLTYSARNGKGKATAALQGDKRSLVGTYGNRSKLRGWRQDPDAQSKPLADFSGLWLTSSGTMMLQQDGAQVSGPYGADGWGSIDGTVQGGRLTFDWKRINSSGSGWFEMTPSSDRLFGSTTGKTPARWIGIRVSDFEHHAEPQAGETVKGHADNGMLYYLRMPNGWQAGQAVDVVVLLHGSNWTTAGMVHIVNKNWPHIGDKFAILGIQGQQWATWSDADDLRFNYNYVSWVGRSTYRGYPYTDRASPYLVNKVLDELTKEYQFERILLGGHSQGGFLTYLMHMNFPEKIAGTFPIASGLIFQAEPSAFDDDALIAAQRDTPMVIVHGRRDRVVRFSTGEYVRNRFLAHDFPKLKMLSPESGHAFDFLPIGDAIDWLDVMSTNNREQVLAYCQQKLEKEEWRDLGAALQRAKLIDAGTIRAGGELDAIEQAFEEAARADTDQLLAAILANENNAWVDDYLDWQESFALAEAGKEVRHAYEALRAVHAPKAKQLYSEARQAFKDRDRESGMNQYREIVEKFYASPRYRSLRDFLAKEDK